MPIRPIAARQQRIVDTHPRELLRGLIQSDGCRRVNRIRRLVAGELKEYKYVRYSFSNASTDIQQIFIDACERLEIRWRRNDDQQLSVNLREDVALLDAFIGHPRACAGRTGPAGP